MQASKKQCQPLILILQHPYVTQGTYSILTIIIEPNGITLTLNSLTNSEPFPLAKKADA